MTCERIAETGRAFEDHVIADIHALLAELAGFRALLDEYRPLLEAWRGTNGGTVGLVRARREARAALRGRP